GKRLRDEREARSLSVEQVAGKLRLDVKQIEAMERDEFTSLVAPVFARGYLRSYARFLQLPADAIIRSYENQKGPIPKVLHGRSVLSDVDGGVGGHDRAMSWVVYLIVLASLILGVVWWQTGGTFKFGQEQTASNFDPDELPTLPDAEDEVEPVPAKKASAAPRRVDNNVVQSLPSQTSNPAPAQGVNAYMPGMLTIPAVPQGQNAKTTTPAPDPQKIPAQAAVPVPVPAPPANVAIPSVVLNLTQQSWVDITDATGNKLVYKLLPAGTHKTLQDLKLPLKVILGNAAGVNLEYSGKPFDHSGFSHKGVTSFELGSPEPNAAQ
ncbi:MAG: RodZ domain-containing protein, partial [Gammaproteobacteria bacterium]